jgi:hypothetical protein
MKLITPRKLQGGIYVTNGKYNILTIFRTAVKIMFCKLREIPLLTTLLKFTALAWKLRRSQYRRCHRNWTQESNTVTYGGFINVCLQPYLPNWNMWEFVFRFTAPVTHVTLNISRAHEYAKNIFSFKTAKMMLPFLECIKNMFERRHSSTTISRKCIYKEEVRVSVSFN